MYQGWISERNAIESECGASSVLNNFPSQVGREVTSSVIRSLVHHPNEKKFFFKADKDIDWTMDVICFGLTMPLSEVEMIKNCVFIYLDWTTVMSATPKVGIPIQIVNKKEFYFKKMLNHLTNLFIPRESTATVLQAKFCSQVLLQMKSIVEEGKLDKETSEYVMRFFLGISGHLLSVPPMIGGLADLLCEQLITSLITVWLHISCYYFPSPGYWCTLREMLLSWRHHPVLILQWNKLMFNLTSKVLQILFGPNYPLPKLYSEDETEAIILPQNLTDELTVQCWFRFLHSIGSPVALTNVHEICSTEHFMQYAMEQGRSPDSHSCLKSLPHSFYKMMKGIAVLVGMFLGSSQSASKRSFSMTASSFARGEWKTMSASRIEKMSKYAKDIKEKPVTTPGLRKNLTLPSQQGLAKDDISSLLKGFNDVAADTNSILHIFGGWLFNACLSGVNMDKALATIGLISCGFKPASFSIKQDERDTRTSFPPVIKTEYELGRAQAFSILCHIFCHQRTVEHTILPVYLSRFYLSLAVGLCYGETRSGQVLGSILLTANNILQIDLQGVQILIPHILQALELILPIPENELALGYDVSVTTLRKSCLEILLSMLCLPLHFLNVPIEGLCRDKVPNHENGSGFIPKVTFLSLKKRITQLLIDALEVETNPSNIEMMLAGTMLLIGDTMHAESRQEIRSLQASNTPPSIILNDGQEGLTGSPKLLHIAKTIPDTHTDKNLEEEIKKEKLKRCFSRSEIGTEGKKDDTQTTQGLFYYMIDRLCQKLMFSGKMRTDFNVTLAALECISDLSQMDSKYTHERSAKKALIWVCEYIGIQAKQPPPAHSKDLHSIIVAAFSCISSWLINHPWLVDDHKCLTALLEVIELGISGSKSKEADRQSTPESPALKADKKLMPVSFRVRQSAEALLALIMEQLDFFPTPNGASNICTLLDEDQLKAKFNIEKFEYYAIDGSYILGLADMKQSPFKDEIPSSISIIRGPTGKRVCLMQMRHLSREKQNSLDQFKNEPVQPIGRDDIPPAPQISQKSFPVEVDRVPNVKADESIPPLEDILDNKNRELQEKMQLLINEQHKEEEKAFEKREQILSKQPVIKLSQPPSSNFHRSSRLLLSHMGKLNIHNLLPFSESGEDLQYLVNDDQELLLDSLAMLDLFSTRTYDTMIVLFVKKGQDNAKEIMSNKIPSLDNPFFTEFLFSLGWRVNLSSHKGWNGDISSSWQSPSCIEEDDKQMIYYSNLRTELAIHVPALNLKYVKDGYLHLFPHSKKGRISEEQPVMASPEKLSADDSTSRQRKITTQFDMTGSVELKNRSYTSQSDTKILVAWLQCYSDHEYFPVTEIIEHCYPNEGLYTNQIHMVGKVPEKEIVVIFIHPLKTGLYRVKVQALFGSHIGGPLVDGMVVSRRSLGFMVRNTALNTFRRRRLDVDSYSPPHICRKVQISEIIRQHSKPCNTPEFFATLFKD